VVLPETASGRSRLWRSIRRGLFIRDR